MANRAIQLATDLVTVAEFSDHAGSYLERVRETGHPIVITKNGKAAGVVMSPEEYDRIYTKLFTESVEKGAADAAAGRVASTQDVKSAIELARSSRKTKK